MSVYEVTDSGGKTIGLWYFDPYARAGKVSERMDGSSSVRNTNDGWQKKFFQS